MLKQCQKCFCWFNSDKPARLCKFCMKEQKKEQKEQKRFADELPERDFYCGDSPDF